jgi:hypothetical protein
MARALLERAYAQYRLFYGPMSTFLANGQKEVSPAARTLVGGDGVVVEPRMSSRWCTRCVSCVYDFSPRKIERERERVRGREFTGEGLAESWSESS